MSAMIENLMFNLSLLRGHAVIAAILGVTLALLVMTARNLGVC